MSYHKKSKVQGKLGSPPKQRGQSLVEFAITLPILLVILLGLAELGSALYSYQVVVNVAREGARYGAKALHTPDENVVAWTRTSAARLGVTTEVDGEPALNGEKATVIVTRLRKVYDEGDYTYEVIDTYAEGGDQPTILTPEWLATQADKSGDLDWPQGVPNQAMDMIAVEVYYNHPHLSGLFDVGQFIPNPFSMHSLTVMRIGGSRGPSCDVYPIALHEDTIDGVGEGTQLPDIYNGDGPGNFGWLRWPEATQSGSAVYLEDSLQDPGMSGQDYDNALDPSDHYLNTDDWVWGNVGISGSSGIRDALDRLIGRRIRVPIWGDDDDPESDGSEGTGNNLHYHIVGFAWVEITGYAFQGQNSQISAVFHSWDDVCSGN